MKNILINNPIKPMSNFLKKYNLIFFIITVTAILVVCVITLTDILTPPEDEINNIISSSNTAFDQNTIDRINKLKTSDDPTNTPVLPTGRINPFIE